jgi:hypothetical protein
VLDALLQAGIEPAPPAEVEQQPAADWQQAILNSYQPQCIVPGALRAQPMQQAAMEGTAPSFHVIVSLCLTSLTPFNLCCRLDSWHVARHCCVDILDCPATHVQW